MPFDPSTAVLDEPTETSGFDPNTAVLDDATEFDPTSATPESEGPVSLMDFMRGSDVKVTEASPITAGQLPQAPQGGLTQPFPKTEEEAIQAQVPEGDVVGKIGSGEPITVGRFGQPGTVARGVSDVASGLLEWALNKPEEALASVTALAPAIAAKYAPEIVKQFSADLGAASAGDKEALGRAVATVGAIAGPAALGKGAKAYLDRKLVNAPSEFAPPKPETVAEYAQMPGAEGAKVRAVVAGEKAIVEPDAVAKAEMQPAPMPEVPVEHAAVIPEATKTFEETIVKPATEVTGEIPLGLRRPERTDPSMRVLSEEEFETLRKKSTKEVEDLETLMDERELTRDETVQLAKAQDQYAAAELEAYRREHINLANEELFHEMLNIVDTLNPQQGLEKLEGKTAFEKFKLLNEILRSRTGREGELAGEWFKRFLAGSADAREVYQERAQKLRDLTQMLNRTSTEGVPNASEISQATTLHGDVLRDVESGTPKEGLPVNEGQQGIRSQTEGRIQETELKPGEAEAPPKALHQLGFMPGSAKVSIEQARSEGIKPSKSGLIWLRPMEAGKLMEGMPEAADLVTVDLPRGLRLLKVENKQELASRLGLDSWEIDNTDRPATAKLLADKLREKGYQGFQRGNMEIAILSDEPLPISKSEPAAEGGAASAAPKTKTPAGKVEPAGDIQGSDEVSVGKIALVKPAEGATNVGSVGEKIPTRQEPITSKPLPTEELKVEPASPNEPPPEYPQAEVDLSDLTPTKTGIKNASVDVQRAERGLPPLERDAPKSDVDLWNAANKRMEEEPGIGERLTRELTEHPRPMTDEEGIILTQRMAKLRNEMDAALNEADKAGNAVAEARDARRSATTREGREIARLKEEEAQARADHYSGEADKLSDAITMVELATGRETEPGVGGAGTLMGRAFRARQFMMREDYTRAGMEMRKRKANGMEPLNSRQRAEIGKLSEQVKRLTTELDALDRKFAKERALKELAELKAKEAKAAATMSERVKAIVGKVGKTLDARADAARERMRGKVMSLSPADLKDIAEIAASNLYHIGEDVGRWSVKMVEEFGETIKPHLDALWKEALRIRDEVVKAEAAPKPTAPRKERKSYLKTAAEVQETIRKRLRTRIAAYEARIAAGDFSPWRKKPAEMDKETLRVSFELEKVKQKFNEGLIEDKMRRRSRGEKLFWGGVEGLNAMRAVLTSADLSAVLRQGLFLGLGHPIRAAKSIGPMLKAFANEKNAYKVMRDIEKRDNYPLYRSSKLYLAEQGASLSKMEEAYLSRWAGKIPLVGRMVKSSERAYITYLNKLRADSFDAMKATLSKDGAITKDQAFLISNFINTATGRGTITMADEAAAGLNALFFAPRFVASRFQLLSLHPIYAGFASGKAPLMSGSAAKARALIATEYARTLAGAGVVYALGLMAGADIELDRRSSDFGKMRFGNTRIDMMGGLAQITVLTERLRTGQKKTLRTGRIVPLREIDGKKLPYGSEDMDEVLWRFLRSKLAPAPGLAWDYLSGSDVVGKPVTAGSLLQKAVTPMSVSDILASMEEQGIDRGTALALLTIFGASVQNFNVYEKR